MNLTLLSIVAACLLGGLASLLIAALLATRLTSGALGRMVAFAAGTMLAAALLEVLPEAVSLASGRHEALFATLLAALIGFYLLERAALWRHAHHGLDDADHDPAAPGPGSAWVVLLGDLNAVLELEPEFLSDVSHEHDDDVTSFVFRAEQPFDAGRLDDVFTSLLQVYGPKLMRYKGVIAVAGEARRIVLQGVHMLMATDQGTPWKRNERRHSKLVFIGKVLPRELIEQGLTHSLALAPPARAARAH